MPPKASAKTKKPVKPPKASLAQGGKEVKPKKETVLEAKPLEVDEKETVEAVRMAERLRPLFPVPTSGVS